MRTKLLTVTMGIVVAMTMLVVGCGSDDTTDASDKPEGPTSSAATSEASAESPLEGSWQADPISPEDMEATLRRHGLDRYVADFRKKSGFSGEIVLTLTLENGEWDLYGATDGGEPEPIDYDAEYEIDGDIVVFEHSDGENTHRWSVDGDLLTLEFVETTLTGYRGIPDEVFQRALYMTASVHEAGLTDADPSEDLLTGQRQPSPNRSSLA